MRLTNLFTAIILLLYITACNNEDDKKDIVPPEGSIKLSELVNHHDYFLPLTVFNDTTTVEIAVLNGDTIDFQYGDVIEFTENGFYELLLYSSHPRLTIDTILFTTTTEERENSEWGIRAWVPKPFETSALSTELFEVTYPHRYADSIKVPFIFYIKEAGEVKAIYANGSYPSTGAAFYIKQGVGSINLNADELAATVSFQLGGQPVARGLTKLSDSDYELQGVIATAMEIPANSFVRITDDLEISASGSLTVNNGTMILIDEAVNINLSGPIILNGVQENPVFITCSQKDKFWGGFITEVSGGTINAEYTIFCQSGYHDGGDYNWGHAGRQALFYTQNSILTLSHCYILDNIGQIFYPQYATLVLNDILVQRAKTGGQINYTDLTINNSIFTDFPDDSYVFADNDNDALYINASDAVIENTKFMFAKDDGMDSGMNEGGTVTCTNCRFEACFHEGAALSSQNSVVKNHTFTGCVFTNCGQGIELGFSSPNHSVVAENCMFTNNGIGIRYGDNYDWSNIHGQMLIINSYSLYNVKDVWNMVRMDWVPKLNNLSFQNTRISKYSPQYPDLEIITE